MAKLNVDKAISGVAGGFQRSIDKIIIACQAINGGMKFIYAATDEDVPADVSSFIILQDGTSMMLVVLEKALGYSLLGQQGLTHDDVDSWFRGHFGDQYLGQVPRGKLESTGENTKRAVKFMKNR